MKIKSMEPVVPEAHEDNEYPYGTQITLSDELYDSLELECDVGDNVMLSGKAIVTSKTNDEHGKSVTFQITDIDVNKSGSSEEILYPAPSQ